MTAQNLIRSSEMSFMKSLIQFRLKENAEAIYNNVEISLFESCKLQNFS